MTFAEDREAAESAFREWVDAEDDGTPASSDDVHEEPTYSSPCPLCKDEGFYLRAPFPYGRAEGPRQTFPVGCTACEAGKRWRAQRWEERDG